MTATTGQQQPCHIAPTWADSHPWILELDKRIFAELLTGRIRDCGHIGIAIADNRIYRWVDVGQGRVLCPDCFIQHLESIPGEWITGRHCDGCLAIDALVTTFVWHPRRHASVYLVALCEHCAPNGPEIDT